MERRAHARTQAIGADDNVRLDSLTAGNASNQ